MKINKNTEVKIGDEIKSFKFTLYHQDLRSDFKFNGKIAHFDFFEKQMSCYKIKFEHKTEKKRYWTNVYYIIPNRYGEKNLKPREYVQEILLDKLPIINNENEIGYFRDATNKLMDEFEDMVIVK